MVFPLCSLWYPQCLEQCSVELLSKYLWNCWLNWSWISYPLNSYCCSITNHPKVSGLFSHGCYGSGIWRQLGEGIWRLQSPQDSLGEDPLPSSLTGCCQGPSVLHLRDLSRDSPQAAWVYSQHGSLLPSPQASPQESRWLSPVGVMGDRRRATHIQDFL